METIKNTPVITYAESTPNPSAMKFVANKIIIENSLPLEFLNPSDAKSSPLAAELFKFPFVKSVFISANYITLFKTDAVEWNDVTLELREFLREYLQAHPKAPPQPSPLGRENISSPDGGGQEGAEDLGEASVDHTVPQNEIEQKIIAVLEQYVRPAVEQDGGMIVFHSYKDGVVSLLMRGACSGCPSSAVTLKAGIEALLKKFVPEVKEVRSGL
ncbi:MAG: NifU family protein [Bacteroidetes bacterium]|nr:NifU family protein [Bacteroidota bacterium]